MWDPVSIFAICWMLNVQLPNSRLNVQDVLHTKEQNLLNNSVTLRQDYEIHY